MGLNSYFREFQTYASRIDDDKDQNSFGETQKISVVSSFHDGFGPMGSD